jgi:hypothetical protein
LTSGFREEFIDVLARSCIRVLLGKLGRVIGGNPKRLAKFGYLAGRAGKRPSDFRWP